MMFNHVLVGTNDLERARAFYDAVMGALGHANGASQAAPVLADDDNADDTVGYGFAVPPHLLQPLPGFRVDLHLPLAVSYAPHGLLERELGRNQGAALLGDFDLRHRS